MGMRSKQLLRIELFIAAILLITNAGTALLSFYISDSLAILSLIFSAMFFCFGTLYVLRGPLDSPWERLDPYSACMHALFAGMLFFFLMTYLGVGGVELNLAVQLLFSLEAFALFFVVLLPLFFIMFMGVYLMKRDWRKERRSKLVLFAIVVLVLILYFVVVLKGVFRADDEELLKMTSVTMLLNGTNPYTASISAILFNHTATVGATLTTKNTLLGVMDYPALFFLLFIPFYFTAAPTLQNLNALYMPMQFIVFIFIFLVTFAYLLDKKDLKRPNLLLLAFSIYAIINISSVTTYVMLALLMFAYARIDSKYAWVFLGLCASIQEELWIPVLLLLAYSFNNHGLKRGAYNALGTLLVFLVLNSYFIAINPIAYVRAVFLPLSQYIVPFNPSPVAFMLLKFYPILQSTYSTLFMTALVFLLLLFLYWNKKKLILLFSLIPFLFLNHVLVSYYAFFLFIFFFALLEREDGKQGVIERQLKSGNVKPVFACALLLVLAAGAYATYTSHAAFERNFNISFVNETVSLDNATNVTTASGTILYHNLTNNTVYLFTVARAGLGVAFRGLINESLISNPQNCTGEGYECLINLNKIVLPGNRTSYPLNMRINWQNRTHEITYVTAIFYNSQYLYASEGANATRTSSG
jgi:hypothetical protein